MSEPTRPTLRKHHGKHSWTSDWRDDRTGKNRCKRFGFYPAVKKRQADAMFDVWLKEQYPKLLPTNLVYPVATLCDEYFADTQKGRSVPARSRLKVALESFKTYLVGIDAPKVTASMVAGWLREYVKANLFKKRQGPKTAETANIGLGYIKRMFQWVIERRDDMSDAAGRVMLVRVLPADHAEARKKSAIGTVDWDRVDATLTKLAEPFKSMVLAQWHSGMRPGEAQQLRTCNLDMSREGVWVYRPVRFKGRWRKNAVQRVVVFGPQAQAVLKPLLRKETHALIFEVNGTPVTGQRYRDAIDAACDAAKVRRWTPNQLRHAFATRVDEMHGPEAVRDLLGHSDLKTQKIYVERTIERAAEVARRIG